MTDLREALVVGAGPVGLTVAHELRRRGVRVRLIDAAEGPATTSRATSMHARTLETFDQMGVVDELLALGLRIEAFTLYQNGRQLARLGTDFTPNPTRYPFTLGLGQVDTERVLRDAVARLGVTVEWGVRITALEQDGDGVRAELRHLDGSTETAEVGWLVGCDGGHSTVRKQLGLPLTGDSHETWLLADADVDTGLARDSLYLVRSVGDNFLLVPLPGDRRWRMIDTSGTWAGTDDDAVRGRFASVLSDGLDRPVTVGPPHWVSVFTAQQRMVHRMRVDRCLVAGDAAHVHSPASGQGLNTGIQEAFNLGWKLAMVIQGHAGPALLDSYDAERVPIGAALLGSTRNAARLVALRSAIAGATQPLFFAVVRNLRPLRAKLQQQILGKISGLNIGYPDGPLTVAAPAGPGPRPGQRVAQVTAPAGDGAGWSGLLEELRDPRWTLLVGPDGATADPARLAAKNSGWLSVRTVDAGPSPTGPGPLPDPGGALRGDLGLGPTGWLLIRPDGYVSARGERLTTAALADALRPLALSAR
ncbi:FAD-binding monooxygenase [Longispora fulva]|uniref:NADPH-dependent dioxygenase n=1 Tax=Longispora fulva TaxID=619741 RepID=A0A8J7KMN2_9ACTN|nr:FAD-dependent oxidoreductase [Longispora fulva]MBG6134202.1 NADPH-dependent dioxygenase [Longispora fulva]GIG63094.1 FAD-binding monooxygenase [Longispora fulva]